GYADWPETQVGQDAQGKCKDGYAPPLGQTSLTPRTCYMDKDNNIKFEEITTSNTCIPLIDIYCDEITTVSAGTGYAKWSKARVGTISNAECPSGYISYYNPFNYEITSDMSDLEKERRIRQNELRVANSTRMCDLNTSTNTSSFGPIYNTSTTCISSSIKNLDEWRYKCSQGLVLDEFGVVDDPQCWWWDTWRKNTYGDTPSTYTPPVKYCNEVKTNGVKYPKTKAGSIGVGSCTNSECLLIGNSKRQCNYDGKWASTLTSCKTSSGETCPN
ncbi:MAG: hypothetical protein SFT91_00970, partial [Rickettsiaceae bacterium]|nr:hypothetical protein [Rickettsiaceae bacterium]